MALYLDATQTPVLNYVFLQGGIISHSTSTALSGLPIRSAEGINHSSSYDPSCLAGTAESTGRARTEVGEAIQQREGNQMLHFESTTNACCVSH